MKLSLVAMLLISSVTHLQQAHLGQKAQLDQELKIKIGQEVSVDELRIKFDSVAEDRRCPCEMECSSDSNAVVIFRLESPQSVAKYIVLTAFSEADEIHSRGYKISLLRLDPCPKAHGSHIDTQEYEATLLVTKSQAATGNVNGKSQGQRKPNFSGKWLHRQARDAGTMLTISLRGTELSLTRGSFAMGREFITKTIYYIDGRTHRTTESSYVEHSSKKKDHKSRTINSLVRWESDKLVIVDDQGKSEWEASESGRELIVSVGKNRIVFKRFS